MNLVKIIRLKQDMELQDCLRIKDLVQDFIKEGVVRVVLDMGKADHVHLAAVPLLAQLRGKLQQYGGGLALADTKEYVRHVFQLCGEFGFPFYATEDQAMDSFR